MAGSFGDAILTMLGRGTDPSRDLLLRTMQAGQPVATPTAPQGADGTTAPAQPAQPTAYTSPPQLLELYDSLLNRSTRERRIDEGIGLMASSFARPENRDMIMGATKGDYQSPSDVFNLVMGLQTAEQQRQAQEQAAAKRQAQLNALPGMAKEYGVDMQTAQMLFDSGQWDDFVMERLKPGDIHFEKDGTGRILAFNSKTGAPVGQPMGSAEPTKYNFQQDGNGQIIALDPVTGLPKGQPIGSPKPLDTTTDDTIEYDRYVAQETAAGRTPESFKDWVMSTKKASASSTTINNSPAGKADQTLVEALDKGLSDEFTGAQSIADTVTALQQARSTLNQGIIAGDVTAPIQLQTRKAIANLFGLPDSATSNTEVFESQMKEIVLPKVKQLGTGNSISNADRDYVNAMVGGDVKLDEKSVRRLLDIAEKGNRRKLQTINKKMQKRIEAAPADSALRQYQPDYIDVPLSPDYVNRTLQPLDPEDRTMLVAHINDPDFRQKFDAAYGDEASRDMYEALMGTDPGPINTVKK